jgi:hypothetical protein
MFICELKNSCTGQAAHNFNFLTSIYAFILLIINYIKNILYFSEKINMPCQNIIYICVFKYHNNKCRKFLHFQKPLRSRFTAWF